MLLFMLFVAVFSVATALPSGCTESCNCQYDCNVCYKNNITVLCLKGNHFQMGQYYGAVLKNDLNAVLNLLLDNYINQRGATYEFLVEKAAEFDQRYSYTYELFLQGVINATGLTVDQMRIINAGSPLLGDVEQLNYKCLFGYVPPDKSTTGQGFALRNFDLDPPFDKVSQYLTLTFLISPDFVPTAFLSMAGEIYCQTCWNKNKLFMELNNGMPTGGYTRNTERQDLLVNLLHFMQNAPNFDKLSHQLLATTSDFSLIISAANETWGQSFEFGSYPTWGTKPYIPNPTQPYVTTNFFLNNSWYVPPLCPTQPCPWLPQDEYTWTGVTRRNNMMHLLNNVRKHNAVSLKSAMDVPLASGGAVADVTVYQVVFDFANFQAYLKRTKFDTQWTMIDINDYFGN